MGQARRSVRALPVRGECSERPSPPPPSPPPRRPRRRRLPSGRRPLAGSPKRCRLRVPLPATRSATFAR
ncbi:hypothetical protein R5R35_009975 [Gryllus longicercus]|uniref:Uncharacterized protein n=1 Tax=Gryllus longicercus TaxID=2509291 RepID=A0AAN9V2I0_9ORTH